jgi:hypothetical protein
VKVRELAGIAAFWQAAEAYLSRDPANNTHQLSAAKRIMDLGAKHGARLFAVYAGDDETALVASATYVDSSHDAARSCQRSCRASA